MLKRKFVYRKKKQNKLALLLVLIVMLMLTVAVCFKCCELKRTYAAYTAREQVLEQQITAEKERTKSIEEYRKYTQTKKYAEEVAKEKLGLVHDGEIIFKEK